MHADNGKDGASLFDLKNDILRQAEYGELTPDEAEIEAERLGFGPLRYEPPVGEFDPMKRDAWSLPMAVAWIAWRSIDAVRDQMDDYREAFQEWRFQTWRVGFEGEPIKGWFLEPRRDASLALLKIGEISRLDADEYGGKIKSIKTARAELIEMLREGVATASGSEHYAAPSLEIPVEAWKQLSLTGDHNYRDVLTFRPPYDQGRRYVKITVPRTTLRELWPDLVVVNTVPPVAAPEGPGHMPLFTAVQWLVTEGGRNDIGLRQTERWEEAYAGLLSHASSGHVEVSGVCAGRRQIIDPVTFARCPLHAPFAPTPDAPQLLDEMCLVAEPYLGDVLWSDGVNDALRSRRGTIWSKLMVSKADVLQLQPASESLARSPLTHTGLAGRPSPRRLVEMLFAERRDQGSVCPSLVEEVREIREAMESRHPDIAVPAQTTAENHLRRDYSAYKASLKMKR